MVRQPLRLLSTFNALWERATDVLAIAAVVVMVSSSVLEIFMRNIFKISIVWASEAAVFCFIWIAYLGAASNTRSGDHFTVDVLPESWEDNKVWAGFLLFLKLFVQVVVGWVLLKYGFQFVQLATNRLSYALGIKMSNIIVIIPIAGLLILFACLEDLLKFFNRKEEGSGE